MSEPGSRLGRYLASRRNALGLGGALAGPLLHLAGVLDGAVWPLVSLGLYGAIALVVPGDPPPQVGEDPLVEVLRHESRGLRRDLRDLPAGVPAVVTGILDALGHVLDRLERIADRPADQVAMPERLARADTLIRHDLPECLAVYRDRSPSPDGRAAAALAEQLGVVAAAVDALAAEVPRSGAGRAEELTRDLRRRYAP